MATEATPLPLVHEPLELLDPAGLRSSRDGKGSSTMADHFKPTPTRTETTFSWYPPSEAGTTEADLDLENLHMDVDYATDTDLSGGEGSFVSEGGYSPPAWRRLGNGDRSSGFWRRSDSLSGVFPGNDLSGGDSDDDDNDDEYGDDERENENDILERARRTRLPTGSMSPFKERSPVPQMESVAKITVKTEEEKEEQLERKSPAQGREIDDLQVGRLDMSKEANGNYVRVAFQVQQRTAMFEHTLTLLRDRTRTVTRAWTSMILSTLVVTMSMAMMRSLLQSASMRPVPDLVKVAGIARSFEPLIFYSENGFQQVGDLQATGVAVWDLGESVRSSNLTSAPIIVKELDELGESLKTLAMEMTKFFANVDGDIDGILIVMDWARRELYRLKTLPSPPLSVAFDNVHNVLTSVGLLENLSTGQPTRLGLMAISLFGPSTSQRTRQTLQRTFDEFLAVLEDAINTELHTSLALFGLFEAIDRQLSNLQRTVTRESSLEDGRHDDLLSSLWTRILGPRAADLHKYERNRALLHDVRAKTVRNKGVLVNHNHRLLALKASLEQLRRRLVSPLVRSANSSTLPLEEQIRGLDDVSGYLETVRARQKGKVYGSYHSSPAGGGGGGGSDTKHLAVDYLGLTGGLPAKAL